MDCLNDYIGIRGQCCDIEPELYIDDLPGVNIMNVADIIQGLEVKPLDLVKRAFGLAIDQVYNDLVHRLSDLYNYNDVICDHEYIYAGNTEYYGEVAQPFNIVINRSEAFVRKFTKICLYELGFVSNKAVTGQEIVIKDEYGTVLKTITTDIEVGYNSIPVHIESTFGKMTIVLDLTNYKIGKNSGYLINNCSRCYESGNTNCMYLTTDDANVGFDVKAKVIADKCAIIKYFFEALKVSLLYKTGINYLLEVKMTNRVNSYTRNSADKIDELLLIWTGGVSPTGQKYTSAYWTALSVAVESIATSLKSLRTEVFKYSGSSVCNNLP